MEVEKRLWQFYTARDSKLFSRKTAKKETKQFRATVPGKDEELCDSQVTHHPGISSFVDTSRNEALQEKDIITRWHL